MTPISQFFTTGKPWRIPCALFLWVCVTHFVSGVVATGDSKWCIHTAESILREGNTNLDEYPDAMYGTDYCIERIDGHCYTLYPLGSSLIALPVVFLADCGLKGLFVAYPHLEPFLIQHWAPLNGYTSVTSTSVFWLMELLIGCLVVASATVMMYFIGREALNARRSLLFALIFAFCTPAWSTGSRSMGQHGPSMLFLGAAIYLFLLSRRYPGIVQYASLPLSFLYVIRPTNAIPIALLTVCVLISHRRYFLRFLMWALPVSIPFFIFNFCIYHAPLSGYYLPKRISGTTHFHEALAGTLISPGRGLLLFTPVVAVALVGFILKVRNKEARAFDWCLGITVVLHWIAISSFPDWGGGHSYGPRYFSDITPIFVFYLIPVLTYFQTRERAAAPLARYAVAALVAISFLFHARGATDWRTWGWNREPADINDAPGRLWDWRDPQFLRGLFERSG